MESITKEEMTNWGCKQSQALNKEPRQRQRLRQQRQDWYQSGNN